MTEEEKKGRKEISSWDPDDIICQTGKWAAVDRKWDHGNYCPLLRVDYRFHLLGSGVSHEQQWLQLWTNTHKYTHIIGRRSSFSFRAASWGRAEGLCQRDEEGGERLPFFTVKESLLCTRPAPRRKNNVDNSLWRNYTWNPNGKCIQECLIFHIQSLIYLYNKDRLILSGGHTKTFSSITVWHLLTRKWPSLVTFDWRMTSLIHDRYLHNTQLLSCFLKTSLCIQQLVCVVCLVRYYTVYYIWNDEGSGERYDMESYLWESQSRHGKHSRLYPHQDTLCPITVGLISASPNLLSPAVVENLSQPHLCMLYTYTQSPGLLRWVMQTP